MRKHFAIILSVSFILLVFFLLDYPLIKSYVKPPVGVRFYGATGYYFDYYQFLSWMRDGWNGKILIWSKYIPEIEKPVLFQPLFPILGMLSRLINLRIDITYHLGRNVFILTWILSIWYLIKTVFDSPKSRKLALLLVLFSSSFPVISKTYGGIKLLPIIDFWQSFYSLQKFMIPLHHGLANTLFNCFLILLMRFPRTAGKGETRIIVKIVVISIIIMLVNPALITFLIGILTIFFMISFIPIKIFEKDKKIIRIIIFLVCISMTPFILYNYYLFNYGNPWASYYYGEKVGRYLVSYISYLASLGPLLLTATLSFIYIRKFRFNQTLLALWAFLPVAMFPFVGRQLPYSMSRLFSLNVFIPCSILSVFFWENFQPKKEAAKMFQAGFILFLIISLGTGFIFSLSLAYDTSTPSYYNVLLPDKLISVINFINKNSKPTTTILAGENVSNLLPAFTDNQVVLGRLDSRLDYGKVKQAVDSIYLRQIGDGEIIEQLKKWRVQYIVFGLDHVGYDQFVIKGKVNGINEIYSQDRITVAEVSAI